MLLSKLRAPLGPRPGFPGQTSAPRVFASSWQHATLALCYRTVIIRSLLDEYRRGRASWLVGNSVLRRYAACSTRALRLAFELESVTMIQNIQRETILDTLLNTLEAERYVRGPLLRTIVDELSTCDGLEMAAEAARSIVERLESGALVEAEFAARIAALRQLVQALSAPESRSGQSGGPLRALAIVGTSTASAA